MSITCCEDDRLGEHAANQATDAAGSAGSTSDEGMVNPNCPTGYLWGGLACVREQNPQVCSTGYTWNGTACVAS